MGKYVAKEIKELSNEIINSFQYPIGSKLKEELLNLGTYKHKKLCKKLIEMCKKENRLSFIGMIKEKITDCIVIWGEWRIIKNSNSPDNTKYDRICFDLRVSINKKDTINDFFNIIISRHALDRLLERVGIDCNTSYKIKVYLDSIIKRIILRCFQIFKDNVDIKPKSGLIEGYEVIDNIFLPIAMEMKDNSKGQLILTFTIKTVIPNKKNLKEQTKLKESILDFDIELKTLIKSLNYSFKQKS